MACSIGLRAGKLRRDLQEYDKHCSFGLKYQPGLVKTVSLKVATLDPIIQHTIAGPAHASMAVRIDLEEQLPLMNILEQVTGTRIIVIGHTVGDELALRTHVVLDGIRESEQTIVTSCTVGRIGESGEQLFILFLLGVAPVIVRNLQARILRKGHFAGERSRTGLKSALRRQIFREGGTLQALGLLEEDAPAAPIRGLFTKGLLLSIVEEPEHATLGEEMPFVKGMDVGKLNLGDERLRQILPGRPLYAGWEVWLTTKFRGSNRDLRLIAGRGRETDRGLRNIGNIFGQAREPG